MLYNKSKSICLTAMLLFLISLILPVQPKVLVGMDGVAELTEYAYGYQAFAAAIVLGFVGLVELEVKFAFLLLFLPCNLVVLLSPLLIQNYKNKILPWFMFICFLLSFLTYRFEDNTTMYFGYYLWVFSILLNSVSLFVKAYSKSTAV